jgi:hypothetical protein
MTSRRSGNGAVVRGGQAGVVAWVVWAAVVTAGLVDRRGAGRPGRLGDLVTGRPPRVSTWARPGRPPPTRAALAGRPSRLRPREADRAGQAVRRPHRLGPRLWPPVSYKLGGPLPSAARPGAGVEGRRQCRRAPGGHPGRRPRAARAAQAGAERLDGPGRPPRPGGAPAGRGAVVLWAPASSAPVCPGREAARTGPAPASSASTLTLPSPNQPGAGATVRPVAPARPLRPPALPTGPRPSGSRARPGHQGRARPEGRLGAGQRRLRHPDRHHRPGGGRRTDLRVLLDGQRRRPRRGPARLSATWPPPSRPTHLPADRRGGRLRGGSSGPPRWAASSGRGWRRLSSSTPCPAGGKVPCTDRVRPRVATVTGIRLGLQLAPAVAEGGGKPDVAYLLPAYLFDLEGGWSDVRAIHRRPRPVPDPPLTPRASGG